MWAISADSKITALTKPDQPTATRKHNTEEDTREAHGRSIKQAAKAPPTTKLRFLRPMCAHAAFTTVGAPTTTPDSAYMFEIGFRSNPFGIAVHIGWPTASGCWLDIN